mmetsp:Transcript_27940/g.51240  ORF Transcript_27940/g.51240 Transcript_27940/m.51240 type:complete len:205 (+) Transcript_27940:737-1351(+)
MEILDPLILVVRIELHNLMHLQTVSRWCLVFRTVDETPVAATITAEPTAIYRGILEILHARTTIILWISTTVVRVKLEIETHFRRKHFLMDTTFGAPCYTLWVALATLWHILTTFVTSLVVLAQCVAIFRANMPPNLPQVWPSVGLLHSRFHFPCSPGGLAVGISQPSAVWISESVIRNISHVAVILVVKHLAPIPDPNVPKHG